MWLPPVCGLLWLWLQLIYLGDVSTTSTFIRYANSLVPSWLRLAPCLSFTMMLLKMAHTCGRSKKCIANTVREKSFFLHSISVTTIQSDEANNLLKGPIVRVNARELHIRDSHFYKDIYAGSGRRVDKYPGAVAAYTVPRANLATVDHDLHRLRRGLMSPYFAKRSIVRLEPIIHERISRLCMRFEESMHQARVIDLDSAFAALTADIVTCYFYGSHFDYLGSKSFQFAMRDAMLGLIRFYHLTRFLPAVASAIKRLPIPVIRLL